MKFVIASVVLMLAAVSEGFAPVANNAAHSVRLNAEATGFTTTVKRNSNFAKLAGGYLFPEIGRRRNAYLEQVRGKKRLPSLDSLALLPFSPSSWLLLCSGHTLES